MYLPPNPRQPLISTPAMIPHELMYPPQLGKAAHNNKYHHILLVFVCFCLLLFDVVCFCLILLDVVCFCFILIFLFVVVFVCAISLYVAGF